MRITSVILVLFLVTSISLHAATTLSGAVGGMILNAEGSPYKITGDIIINKGKCLTLKEGCVLLFNPFTGLVVEGKLNIEGVAEKPVVFTSVNDGKYNDSAQTQPQPFDWNGILLQDKTEEVRLSNFVLSYSVYGIKSKTDNLTINNGVFYSNGQFNFTINDRIIKTNDNFPFSYNYDNDANNAQSHKRIEWQRPIYITTGSASLAAFSIMSFFISKNITYRSQYRKATDQSIMDDLIKKQEIASTNSVICGAVGCALGVTSAAIFIANKNDKKKKRIALQPYFGTGYGLFLSFVF